nr:dihydropteroate synthase [Liberibacter crescens]
MAIVNVTPDSFSDGGHYSTVEKAVAHAMKCLEEGADILDIGGESTRPGASSVSLQEEQDRIMPVMEKLVSSTDALVSVDTYHAETAKMALGMGAHIINDVYGLQFDSDMAAVIAAYKAGVCIMHTGRGRDKMSDILDDQIFFLKNSVEIAKEAGISCESMVIDPGFGFGKEVQDNIVLLSNLSKLTCLDIPLLVGVSRKSFIAAVTEETDPKSRDVSTAIINATLRMAGAAIFRVHNVAMTKKALLIADTMIANQRFSSQDSEIL